MTEARTPPIPSVPALDLYGADIPAWLIARSTDRANGYSGTKGAKPIGHRLVSKWAMDYSGLPAGYRHAWDRLSQLNPDRTWTDRYIIDRLGISLGYWRRWVRPNLVKWGWLVYTPGIGHRGCSYIVQVPIDEPPDRVAKPGRARPGNDAWTYRKMPTLALQDADSDYRKMPTPPLQDADSLVGRDVGREKVGIEVGSEERLIHILETGYDQPPPQRQLTLGTDELARRRWRDPLADEQLVADHLLSREQ